MTKLNEELRARIEAVDPKSLYVPVEEIISQFEKFEGKAEEPRSYEHPSGYITAAIVHSESGDEFLEVFPGALSAQEVAVEVFLDNPEWWSEPDLLYISELRVCSVAAPQSFPEPDWEYGYKHVRDDGTELPVREVSRTPDNWMTTMGRPYRRRRQIDAGEWELAPDDVVFELDPRPWLRPGGHPEHHPLDNRTAHKVGEGWEFKPRSGYEPSIERYGFRESACGRTDSHWAHSSPQIAYCNGLPR